MKKISILCCFMAIIQLCACDSYLDLVPKGESVLNTTDDYLGLLEDIYGFPMDEEWYLCGEQTTHNMQTMINYTYPNVSAAFYFDENFDRAKYSTKTGASDMYSECYRRIAKFNVIIDNINNATGPDEDKTLGIAQAKILRAYNYFYLINTYAKQYDPATAETDRGIILRSKFNMEEVGVQETVAKAYELIQQDINDAINELPHKSVNNFRPDKSFGLALKAKVHLYMRQIDDALKASLDAIDEAENNAGRKLWNMNDDYNTLMTFLMGMFGPMEFMFQPGGAFYNMITTYSSMAFSHGYESSENLLYQHGINMMSPLPSFIRKPVIDLYDPDTDLRHYLCFMKMNTRPTSESGSLQFIASNIKWNCGGMKLSEVYLIVAECYARKGDTDNALQYLNKLRKNRLQATKYVDIEANSADEAFKLIRDERKRELLFTSNGFFDMKRFAAEYNETNTREIDGTTYSISPSSHLYVFPFPVSAMQNSNLVQNSI